MFLLLSIRMVPAAAVVVPVFLMYTALGWKDTFWGVILFYAMFSIPFSVWILKGFIDGVSPRYDETGLVNGGSRLHVMFRVVLPQVRPGPDRRLHLQPHLRVERVPVQLHHRRQEHDHDPGEPGHRIAGAGRGGLDVRGLADASIYLLPPIVAIYFFQKYLLVGMTFGTVRGEV